MGEKVLFKVIFLGDGGVGKSSLINRFVQNTFSNRIKATIGADFSTKTVQRDKKNITLQLWDTSGRESYHSLTPMFYRGANGIMVLYDITNKRTFEDLRSWNEELKILNTENSVVFLVGTKSDLESQRAVTVKEAQDLAMNLHFAAYIETSSKTGENVEEAFIKMTDVIEKNKIPTKEKISTVVVDANNVSTPSFNVFSRIWGGLKEIISSISWGSSKSGMSVF